MKWNIFNFFTDSTVNSLSNCCRLKSDITGTGFYRVQPKPGTTEQELVLGPFQGPVACMHIAYGRGVCGAAWQQRQTIVVPDVDQFPGHIACSSLSRSEIVVPLFSPSGDVTAVLDIDSRDLATFDDLDRQYLEQITRLI